MPLVDINTLIEKAIASHVVSFPTDTLPALAVKPSHSQLIFKLKQRSLEKPLILMTSSIEEIWDYVQGTPEELKIWQNIAQKHLPGPLTMVLPASEKIPPVINPLNPQNIGVRVPKDAMAQEILSKTGALATTSANLSGEKALTNMPDIAQKFPSVYALDVQDIKISGVASTVIKWTGKDWQILRQGQILIQ